MLFDAELLPFYDRPLGFPLRLGASKKSAGLT